MFGSAHIYSSPRWPEQEHIESHIEIDYPEALGIVVQRRRRAYTAAPVEINTQVVVSL